MKDDKHWLLRTIATLTAGALIITAPGLDCYRVLAADFAAVTVPVTAGAAVVPVVPGYRGSLPGYNPGNAASTLQSAPAFALPKFSPAANAAAAQSISGSLGSVIEKTQALSESLNSAQSSPEKLQEGAAFENVRTSRFTSDRVGLNGAADSAPEPVAALGAYLETTYAPGTALSLDEVVAAGARVGLNSQQVVGALVLLSRDKRVLEIGGGQFLNAVPRRTTGVEHVEAVGLINSALKRYDPADAAAMAEVVSKLNAAQELLAKGAPVKSAKENYELARVVKVNASMALLSRLTDLVDWKDQPHARASHDARQEELKAIWLDSAFVATNRSSDKMTKDVQQKVRDFLHLISEVKQPENETGLRNGLAVMRQTVTAMKAVDNEKSSVTQINPGQSAKRTDPDVLDTSKFKALNEFGTDLTNAARNGKLRPLIGREAEMHDVVEALARWTKNNPVIIGEHGVGKTQIVDGLAQMIADGKIASLKGKVIYRLDLGALIAGTVNRGMFEQRVVDVLKEVKSSNGRVILFIDEIHKIMGLGSGGSDRGNDAANMIKEALQNGELSLIAATTLNEYRQIEKDGALARRFIPIRVHAPSRADTLKIVTGLAKKIEEHNKVKVTPAAVEAAIDLSDKYLADRFQPDKAIDLLVAAAAMVQLSKPAATLASGIITLPEVTEADVALKVSKWTGVPAAKLTESDRDSLKGLEEAMKSRVIHQDEAVAAVSKAVRRARMGYSGKHRPKGRFLFLGPTGVGKTEVARVLAQQLFGDKKSMLRIDMSEYQDKESVARMIGAPPGYIGHDNPGQLTEAVRQKPYTVLLFDEVEKAHEKVLDVLLQILEEGSLTDGQGKTVDFSNTYVILTSNVGASALQEAKKRRIGFNIEEETATQQDSGRKNTVQEAARASFKPELLNRLDEIVAFNSLDKADIAKILEIQLADLNVELAAKRMTVSATPAAKAFLVERGFDPKYGARPLERAIQKELKDLLVDAEIDGKIKEGDHVTADLDVSGAKLVVTGAGRTGSNGASAPRSNGARAGIALAIVAAIAAPLLTFATPMLAVGTLEMIGAPLAVLLPLAATMLAVTPFVRSPGSAPKLKGTWKAGAAAFAAAMAIDLGTKALAAYTMDVMYHDLDALRLAGSAIGAVLMTAVYLFAHKIWAREGSKLRNPAVKRVLNLQRWYTGALLGVSIGQMAEGLIRGKVADWIFMGGIATNIADLVVWGGVVQALMTSVFLWQAQKAERGNAPITMPTFAIYAPVLGALAVAFLMLPAASNASFMLSVYGTFLGLGVLVSDAVMYRMTKAFNRSYGEAPALAAATAGLSLPWTFRLHRKILAVMAGVFGMNVSAPRIPQTYADRLLQRLQDNPPDLIVMDYDWTLQTNNKSPGTPVSPETAAALEKVQRAGSILAVATDRPFDDEADRPEDQKRSISHLLVNRLNQDTRRDMLVAVLGGGEIYQYNGKGDKPKAPISSIPPFSDNEMVKMSEIIQRSVAAVGLVPADVNSAPQNVRYTIIMDRARTEGWKKSAALAEEMRKLMREAGLGYSVEHRYPANPSDPPYIVIRKADKSASILGILKILREQGIYVSPHKILILGDETGKDGLDSTMARAVPEATMISVGKRLDPRIDNALFWPVTGPESTLKILQALGQHYAETNPEHIFSYSQLDLKERSPKEFRERYGKGSGHKSGQPYKQPLPAFVGTRAHEAMHWLYAQGIPGRDLSKPSQQQELLEKLGEVYKKLWDQNFDAEKVDTEALPYDGLPESLKDLDTAKDRKLRVQRYYNHGLDFVRRLAQKNMPFAQDKSIGMEYRIYYTIQGPVRRYLFQAIIDRASVSNDGYLEIHEYKTGRTPTVEAFKANLQMPSYAIGLRLARPEFARMRVRLHRHGPDGDMVWEPSEAELESARLQLAARAEEILKDLNNKAAEAATPDAPKIELGTFPDDGTLPPNGNGTDNKVSALPMIHQTLLEAVA